jgi:hypothetical protein
MIAESQFLGISNMNNSIKNSTKFEVVFRRIYWDLDKSSNGKKGSPKSRWTVPLMPATLCQLGTADLFSAADIIGPIFNTNIFEQFILPLLRYFR